MMWWLTVHTPDGAVCWLVADDADRRDEQVCRARVLTGFPAGDDWIRDPAGLWRITLADGPPHQRLRAVQRDADELESVDSAAVDAYRSKRDQAASAARRQAARAALLQCAPDERAQVIGEMPSHDQQDRPEGSPRHA